MADSLPVTIQMGALPVAVKWTPQQLADAMVARMRLVTAQTFALFVSGSTVPSSNVGPWLKNGTEWWVWSNTAGTYVPITIPASSLGYFIGSASPDHTVYNFWIETTVGGSPLALKIYYSGAWVDVYAATLASYLTTAAFNTAIASYSTTAQMNTAIAAGDAATLAASETYTDNQIAAIPPQTPFAAYPAQGVVTGQTILIDGSPHQVQFNAVSFNPLPAPFDIVAYRYVAPAAGYYNVSFSSQFDNVDGTPAGMQVAVSLYKNGVFVGFAMADLDNTPSPAGDRWSPGFSGLVQLAINDYIEIFVEITDGVDTGHMTLTSGQFSVNRVQAV